MATSVQRRAPVILAVIPPGTTHKTGGDQADGTADLTCEDCTRRYPMDGAEATHNRSVASSGTVCPQDSVDLLGQLVQLHYVGVLSPLIAQLHLVVAVGIGPGAVGFAGAEPVGPSADLVGCFLYVRDGR